MRKNGTLIIDNGKGTLKQGHKIMSADFMRRAIALGLENVRTGRGGPFAALVVKDGCVVAEGANRVTTTNDPTPPADVLPIPQPCPSLRPFHPSRPSPPPP